MPSNLPDRHLQSALIKAYSARATLFHMRVVGARMRAVFRDVDHLRIPSVQWQLAELGISEEAFSKVGAQKIAPHKVFVHPEILIQRPRFVVYYRNLVAISQKGMSQLGFSTGRFERAKPAAMPREFANRLAQTHNSIISKVIESLASMDISAMRDVVFAELGTELQGTWANLVGKGAAKAVEDILADYISTKELGTKEAPGTYSLKNGWRISIGSEPDIKFSDPNGVERIVIEIKGSLDRAGAQTRYGEAKKTFAKALNRNPRCHTVYLASCITQAVADQIQMDGQVRDTFNLTSIVSDLAEKERFLRKLFHIVQTPT